MRSLATFAVVMNVLTMIVFGWLGIHTMTLGPVEATALYTELDRAGVIDQQRLAQTFPNLAVNDRYLVPRWLIDPMVSTDKTLALCGLILVSFNLMSVLVLRRELSRTPDPASADKLS